MPTITIKKGTILQRKGDINTKTYFVKRGLLRSYIIDEKGKEHIFMFGPENWLVADSTGTNIPAELFIDALEDSTIHILSKDIDNETGNSKSLFKRISVLQKRVLLLMSATAIERYTNFINTYPEITQRVPQRMIASYLGITPEALSKVKNEVFKSKLPRSRPTKH